MGKRSSKRRAPAAPAPAETETELDLAAKRSQPPLNVTSRVERLSRLSLLACIALLAFRPIRQNDFWLHLRVGEDILDQHVIPRVDVYSAVAAGRPFVAHEWLSGVVLALVERVLGPLGFSLLAQAAAGAIAYLLWAALPQHLRRSALLVPAVLLSAYLSEFRLVIRPDVFTMILLAAWTFALERWRVDRNTRQLFWLVPLSALWANLHGAYLFGVLSLALFALAIALLSVFPHWQGTGERPYTRGDARGVLRVAALVALACLLNPHGFGLLRFSSAMWSSPDYAQVRAVTEWQPPFGSGSYFQENFAYLAWAYAVALLLLWSGLALRWRTRPLLDLGQAALLSLLSIRENRFIPYFALVTFPVLLRSWHAILLGPGKPARWLESPARSGLDALLVGASLLLTLVSGYPLGPGKSSALGLGFASNNPSEEVAFMRREGLHGNLYNEQMTEGAFLIHELFPAVKPAMDMRLDVYGAALCAEYDATKQSASRLSEYLDKYGFNLALVTRGGWMEQMLTERLRWRRRFSSEGRSVLSRAEEAPLAESKAAD